MGSERAVDGRGQGQWKVVWMGSERAVDGQGEAVDGRWMGSERAVDGRGKGSGWAVEGRTVLVTSQASAGPVRRH